MKIQIVINGEEYIRADSALDLDDDNRGSGYVNIAIGGDKIGYIRLDEILPALQAFNNRVMGEATSPNN